MRKLIVILALLLSITNSFAQTDTSRTEIILLGIIHTGNKQFNFKTLYKTIKENTPDIILWEQNEQFKRVFGLITAYRLKIAKPSIEQLALQKFTSKNRKVPVFGFDTLITSRKHYLKTLIKTKDLFHDSLYRMKKSFSDSIDYDNYSKKYNEFYNFIGNARLSSINQPDVVRKSSELYYLEEKQLLPMGKKYIADSSLVNQFQNEIEFWIARNEYMANKILTYAEQFKGKRMIVLTGLNHKYYLQNRLNELGKNTINIVALKQD